MATILAVIPARLEATRFPAKVLAKETGKYLIEHTYQQARKAKLLDDVIIAADDAKVVSAAVEFGAKCVLTDSAHQSGTDRIAEAVAELDVDIVINLQADEPEIEPSSIDLLAGLLLENPNYDMATLVAEFESPTQVRDPNMVKAITDSEERAIYFSRSVIPYDRQSPVVADVKNYLRHLGVYAYRKPFLLEFTKMPPGRLEQIEKLEQLRALEAGRAILTAKVNHIAPGIDTPEQYAEFVQRYKENTKT